MATMAESRTSFEEYIRADSLPPADITLRVLGIKSILVTWTIPEDVDYWYTEVWVSRQPCATKRFLLADVPATQQYLVHAGLPPESHWHYWLRAWYMGKVPSEYTAMHTLFLPASLGA